MVTRIRKRVDIRQSCMYQTEMNVTETGPNWGSPLNPSLPHWKISMQFILMTCWKEKYIDIHLCIYFYSYTYACYQNVTHFYFTTENKIYFHIQLSITKSRQIGQKFPTKTQKKQKLVKNSSIKPYQIRLHLET